MNNLIAVSNPCYGLQADEHFQPSELSQYLSTDFGDNFLAIRCFESICTVFTGMCHTFWHTLWHTNI